MKQKNNCLTVGKLISEDSVLEICIDSKTNRRVKVKYNGEVIYKDKKDFQEAAIVFWNTLRINDLPISKYNKCPNLKIIFENGSLNQLKDGRLICENIFPITYELFYCIAEEYKEIIEK